MTGRNMRFLILFLTIVAGFAAVSNAQTAPKAYKFAEFGKMSQADVKEKMEGFLVELAKDRSPQGYIITYGSPRAIAARRKQLTNSITFSNPDPTRMTYIDGGPEKTVRTIMWIVPPGAEPPTPSAMGVQGVQTGAPGHNTH
jgi:hypothetical protein